MMTNYMQDNSQQQALEILTAPVVKRKTRKPDRQRILKRRLNEVILGKRPALKLYSKTLQSDCWFVNEGLVNPEDAVMPGKVITMEMLADMIDEGGSFDHLLSDVPDSA